MSDTYTHNHQVIHFMWRSESACFLPYRASTNFSGDKSHPVSSILTDKQVLLYPAVSNAGTQRWIPPWCSAIDSTPVQYSVYGWLMRRDVNQLWWILRVFSLTKPWWLPWIGKHEKKPREEALNAAAPTAADWLHGKPTYTTASSPTDPCVVSESVPVVYCPDSTEPVT